MNRYLALFVSLVLGHSVIGQQQIAVFEYNDPEDWIAVSLTLTSDSSFLWKSCNGYGNAIALGNYSIDKNDLTLRAVKAYRFNENSYEKLILEHILDSCCNVEILKGGKITTEYNQTFYNLQSKADSCILNNMECILTSNRLNRAEKHFAFRDTFIFTNFTIKDKDTIIFQRGSLSWTLKRLK